MFSYNSGYGYDALEYLVIARSILDGHAFYSFIPSKSFGLYYVTAFYLAFFEQGTHLLISALVTAIFALTVLATFIVASRDDYLEGVIAAILVGLSAAFMELNFLEPEGLVYFFGLLGFCSARRAVLTGKNRYWFFAGMAIGVSTWFKSIGLLYLVGVWVFQVNGLLRRKDQGLRSIGLIVVLTGAGTLLIMIAAGAYFGITDRFVDHVYWTYFYPLLYRPADYSYVNKLWSKLLWFNVLVVICIVLSFLPGNRRALYERQDTALLLALGLAAMFSLVKVQASHYLFPGAAFLCFFCARVIRVNINSLRNSIPILAVSVLLLALSVALFRPDVFSRLYTFKSYTQEESIGEEMNKLLVHGEKALFFKNSTWLYWVSGKYPNVPFVNFEIQTSHFLKDHPEVLNAALDDPELGLVEFCSQAPSFQDSAFLETVGNAEFIDDFYNSLRSKYTEKQLVNSDYCFWVRDN